MTRKYIMNFEVVENVGLHPMFSLLKLRPETGVLPEILPGQFVQVEIPDSPGTFLRRPISVNFVDYDLQLLWLLVRNAGEGTAHLVKSDVGSVLNLLLPLGKPFSLPVDKNRKVLLVGGGVGVAPLLYLGEILKRQGMTPEFLLGARTAELLLERELFEKIGIVHIATDDGSTGHHGLVTTHPVLFSGVDMIYCCGPAPMMKGIAAEARNIGAECEVSLENMMACGLGACLCCVERTVRGNVCVCTEGPVFNIKELTW